MERKPGMRNVTKMLHLPGDIPGTGDFLLIDPFFRYQGDYQGDGQLLFDTFVFPRRISFAVSSKSTSPFTVRVTQ
jgi:hypothetical protein